VGFPEELADGFDIGQRDMSVALLKRTLQLCKTLISQ